MRKKKIWKYIKMSQKGKKKNKRQMRQKQKERVKMMLMKKRRNWRNIKMKKILCLIELRVDIRT